MYLDDTQQCRNVDQKTRQRRVLLFSQRAFKCRFFCRPPRRRRWKECLMKHLLDLTVKKTTLESCNESLRAHVAKLAESFTFAILVLCFVSGKYDLLVVCTEKSVTGKIE